MADAWYEAVDAATPLTQGDLIFDCPLLTWQTADHHEHADSAEQPPLTELVRAFREDVVVMTQACDLEHHKVENVVLCPHVSLATFQKI